MVSRAPGVLAVTVEWGRRHGRELPRPHCWCGPRVIVAGRLVGLVHHRAPAGPDDCPRSLASADEHVLAAVDGGAAPVWAGCADALYCAGAPEAGGGLLAHVLARHPGCLLAGVRAPGGGCAAQARDGRRMLVTGPRLTPGETCDVLSLLHGWAARGVQFAEGEGPSRLLMRSSSRWVSLGLMAA